MKTKEEMKLRRRELKMLAGLRKWKKEQTREKERKMKEEEDQRRKEEGRRFVEENGLELKRMSSRFNKKRRA